MFFCANIGNIPLMTLLSTFFLIFYTDVVGLNPSALATLFLISKVVDGLSDTVMGILLDKFPVIKMGRFRPLLMLGLLSAPPTSSLLSLSALRLWRACCLPRPIDS